MTSTTTANDAGAKTQNRDWLRTYYVVRALFSAAWVASAFTIGSAVPLIGIALAVIYPAWDALANWYDARRSGGLAANLPQATNVAISTVVTLAVCVAATQGFHAVVGVIGAWAALAGILQLATAVRRWRTAGGQWPMVLSGAQSALAGTHFVTRALDPSLGLTIADVAPYAAFGAAYFAISAAILAFSRRR